MGNAGGGGGKSLDLPLGLGGGGLFLATDSIITNRKAITIKNVFIIVFILYLKTTLTFTLQLTSR